MSCRFSLSKHMHTHAHLHKQTNPKTGFSRNNYVSWVLSLFITPEWFDWYLWIHHLTIKPCSSCWQGVSVFLSCFWPALDLDFQTIPVWPDEEVRILGFTVSIHKAFISAWVVLIQSWPMLCWSLLRELGSWSLILRLIFINPGSVTVHMTTVLHPQGSQAAHVIVFCSEFSELTLGHWAPGFFCLMRESSRCVLGAQISL